MSEETTNALAPKASQMIIDRAKSESHQWLNPESWKIMQVVAQTFLASGAMPASMNTAQRIIVALQAGKEAGMQPLESINSFYFVNGKISLYGEMAISQVIRCGHKVEWGKCDEKSATVTITRGDNKASSSVTFTMEQAISKGLTKDNKGVAKTPWVKFPENMLRFKAFHSCSRFIVPDALHGIKIKEVEEAEESEYEIIEEKTENRVSVLSNKEIKKIDENSMEEAINKPTLISEDQLKKLNKLIKEKNRTVDQIISYYKVASFDELTSEQAESAILILEKAEKRIVEEMPPVEKKPKSKAAKYMESALKKKDESEDRKSWPGDVCRYLRFIDTIPDEDLPEDIRLFKMESMTGEWKGYDYYPSLRDQIAQLPEEFE